MSGKMPDDFVGEGGGIKNNSLKLKSKKSMPG